MILETNDPQETFEIGRKIGKLYIKLNNPNLILLEGDLGSGKTVLTKGIASGMGINKTIPSPTFIIVRQYKINNAVFKYLYHIDLYRIESTDLKSLGLDEIINDPKNLIIIEWAEKIKEELKEKKCILVKFVIKPNKLRILNINYNFNFQ